MSSVRTFTMTSAPGGFNNLTNNNDGFFCPRSTLNAGESFQAQMLPTFGLPVRNSRVVIEDMYIDAEDACDVDIFYNPNQINVLPSAPTFANGWVGIYAYAGRSNVNPFHVDDDFATRLTPLIFSDLGSGALQFFTNNLVGSIRVTIQWSVSFGFAP